MIGNAHDWKLQKVVNLLPTMDNIAKFTNHMGLSNNFGSFQIPTAIYALTLVTLSSKNSQI